LETFDCHSDILIDVTVKRGKGEKNILKKYHLNSLKKGHINGLIAAIWIDPPFINEPEKRLLDILGATCEEIDDMKYVAAIACSVDDIYNIQKSGRIAVILGIEGLNGINANVSVLNMLYRIGLRHASLTWNEENEFATGVGSPNNERGVTDLGVLALKKMEELGILIDVSHANEKTFWDIYEKTTKPFIASHSNVYNLYNDSRNLKDDQIKAIAERKGVIGINSWPGFIGKQPSVERLIDHIDYIACLVGVDYVSLGFDFCDFFNTESLTFAKTNVIKTPGIENHSQVQNVLKILEKRGYNNVEIQKIAFKNIMRVFQEVL